MRDKHPPPGRTNPPLTMAADKEIIQVASTSMLCLLLICMRGIYRLAMPCRNHTHVRCHRKWHVDDLWMAFSILPLTGRALCIAWSNSLLDEHTIDAAKLSRKLLLPGRVFYVLLYVFPSPSITSPHRLVVSQLGGGRAGGVRVRL